MLIFVLYTIGIIFLFYLLDYILNKVKLPKGYIEVNKKYDVGKIYNRRTIDLDKDIKATRICFLYLYNLDFLKESVKKIELHNFTENKNYEKINLVPSFFRLLNLSIKYFFGRTN